MGHRPISICVITVAAVALVLLPRLSPSTASSAALANQMVYLPLLARSTSGPTLGGCLMFPADNIWNKPIDSLPRHSQSDNYISFIGAGTSLHPDFGANWNGGPFGIPFDLVPGTQPMVPIRYKHVLTAGASDSDGVQALWHYRGRQRQQLVHQRRAGCALGRQHARRRIPASPWVRL